MPVLSNIKPHYKTTVVKKESRILTNKIAQWNRIEAHKLNRKMQYVVKCHKQEGNEELFNKY